ncbi:MAG: hypothetical protein LBN39_13365 [Planctomycetaceae bacterium]|jgi:glycerophosphoryl diester phosphodiesterase|nr:hypothetical protein [Planctomycetaceae bacterium]
MKHTALSFCILLTAAVLSAQQWNVRDHILPDEFAIQAHRGAGNLSPENSIDAFEIAWKLGVIPEADLRNTKDGVIVAFHDNNFQRILPNASDDVKKKGVADLTLAEVKQLDIGAWKGPEHKGQGVASMAEIIDVLKKFPKRKMYIDIKNVDFLQLANETKEVHRQLILASTNYNEILLWKRLAPASKTLHWMGGTEEVLAVRLDRLEKHRFDSVDQLQIHVNTDAAGKFTPSEDFLYKTGGRLRKYNVLFQVLPWENAEKNNGGSNPDVYKRLMNLGVASFATDFPDVNVKAVKEYYGEK